MPDLLRICTAGSVDDGKSTLIGRLLYDSRGVYEDQLHSVRAASQESRRPGRSTSRCSPTACAPSASRASPSTSPTAISRPRGASSSSPIRPGTNSTRATWRPARRRPTSPSCSSTRGTACGRRRARHARIARLLGISSFVLAVNKMDLVGFDAGVFDAIRDDFADVLDGAALQAIPISALARRQRDRAERAGRPGSTARACSRILETVEVPRPPHVGGPSACRCSW